MNVNVEIVKSAPRTVEAIGVPVASSGPVARQLGLGRAALAANGFEGKAGQVLVLPAATGPTHIAIGIGEPGAIDAKGLRD
ncbi:MAG: cytosol aminopeptidase, partial [Actinomycetota bacterium]